MGQGVSIDEIIAIVKPMGYKKPVAILGSDRYDKWVETLNNPTPISLLYCLYAVYSGVVYEGVYVLRACWRGSGFSVGRIKKGRLDLVAYDKEGEKLYSWEA